jgi:hypothetical protein
VFAHRPSARSLTIQRDYTGVRKLHLSVLQLSCDCARDCTQSDSQWSDSASLTHTPSLLCVLAFASAQSSVVVFTTTTIMTTADLLSTSGILNSPAGRAALGAGAMLSPARTSSVHLAASSASTPPSPILTKPLSLYGVLSQAIHAARGSGAVAESVFSAFWHRFGIGTSRLVQPVARDDFSSLLDYAEALVQHLRPQATVVSAAVEGESSFAAFDRNPPAPPSVSRSVGGRRTFIRLDEDEDGDAPDCKFHLPEVELNEEKKGAEENPEAEAEPVLPPPPAAATAAVDPATSQASEPTLVDEGCSNAAAEAPVISGTAAVPGAGASPGRKRVREDDAPTRGAAEENEEGKENEEKKEEMEPAAVGGASVAAIGVESQALDSVPMDGVALENEAAATAIAATVEAAEPTLSESTATPSSVASATEDKAEFQSPKKRRKLASANGAAAAASPSSPMASPTSTSSSRKRIRELAAEESPDLVLALEASPEVELAATAAAAPTAELTTPVNADERVKSKKAKLTHAESAEPSAPPAAADDATAATPADSTLTEPGANGAAVVSVPDAPAAGDVDAAPADSVAAPIPVSVAAVAEMKESDAEMAAAAPADVVAPAAVAASSKKPLEIPLSELSNAMLSISDADVAAACGSAAPPRTRPVLHLVNLLRVDAKSLAPNWAATADCAYMRDVLEKLNIDYIVHHPNADGKFMLVGASYPLSSDAATVTAWVKRAGDPTPKEEVLPKASILSLVFANLNTFRGTVAISSEKAGEARQVPVAELPSVATNPTVFLVGSGKAVDKTPMGASASFPVVLASMKSNATEGINRTLEDNKLLMYPAELHKLWDRVLNLVLPSVAAPNFKDAAIVLNKYASLDSDTHQLSAAYFALTCKPSAQQQ